MYILTCFNLAVRTIFSTVIACVLLVSCTSSDRENAAIVSGCEQKAKEEAKKLKDAYAQIQQKNKNGLVAMFEIASGSTNQQCSFAELSETAGDLLSKELLIAPGYWIKSLSEIDIERIKEFLNNGGLAAIEADEQKKDKAILLAKLKKYNGPSKEMVLRNTLINYLGKAD